MEGADMSLARMDVFPESEGELHYHPNCFECVYVMSGSIGLIIDHQHKQFSAGETVLIPTGITHRFVNTSSSVVSLMVVYSSGHREYCNLEHLID